MALFRRKADPRVDQLIADVTSVLEAQGVVSARSEAQQLVRNAAAEAEAEGDYPEGFGDVFLAAVAKGDEGGQRTLERLRSESVTDDDIRWYWNMHPIARRVMEALAEQAKFAHFVDAMSKAAAANPTLSREALAKLAGDEVRRWHPMYGDPRDPHEGGPEDRPLPNMLKDRVDRYLMKHGLDNVRQELGGFSSFNAWCRRAIAEGRL